MLCSSESLSRQLRAIACERTDGTNKEYSGGGEYQDGMLIIQNGEKS